MGNDSSGSAAQRNRRRRQGGRHPGQPRPRRRARWPSWSRRPTCPAPRRTGWPWRSRCTGCSPATARAASCSGPRLGELAAALPDPLITAAAAGAGLGARRVRRERPAVPARRQRPGVRRRGRAGQRAAHDRAGRLAAAADGRLGRAGAVRLVAIRPRCRTSSRRSAVHGPRRWPRSAGGAGRSRSASARPAWRRCRRRCCSADGELLAAISISGPVERLGRTPGQRFAPVLVAGARRITAALG